MIANRIRRIQDSSNRVTAMSTNESKGSFFKRFSISSSKSSFSSRNPSITGLPPVPDPNARTIDKDGGMYNAQQALENISKSSQSDRDDKSEISSASTLRKDRSVRSMFSRKSKRNVTAVFSISEEFSRYDGALLHLVA
jgi:hypothetical protein